MPYDNWKTANRTLISADSLETKFDAGLEDFTALLNSIENSKNGELIEFLDRVSDELVTARS